jgi:hypothetical protein
VTRLHFPFNVAQLLHSIARAFDFGELTRNDFAHLTRQSIVESFFESAHGGILSALTFRQDRFVLSAGYGGFQGDPGSMHRSGRSDPFFWL